MTQKRIQNYINTHIFQIKRKNAEPLGCQKTKFSKRTTWETSKNPYNGLQDNVDIRKSYSTSLSPLSELVKKKKKIRRVYILNCINCRQIL